MQTSPKKVVYCLLLCWMLLPLGLLPLGLVCGQELKQDDSDFFVEKVRPFIEAFCLDCHTGEGSEAGIDLDQFETQAQANSSLELWSHVLAELEQSKMPPADADQPNAINRKRIQDWILASIEKTNKNTQPRLGRLRRMNRSEYENTIRDLFRLNRNCFSNSARILQTTDYFQPATGRMPRSVLAVSYFYNSHHRHSDLFGVSNLPVDPPTEHGFANDQEALSLSPLLMEQYFEIASSLLKSREFAQISGLYDSLFQSEAGESETELLVRAKTQLAQFLPRAFRRTVADDEHEVYLSLFSKEFAGTNSYTESMQTTISAVLVSPSFLFRLEYGPKKVQADQRLVKNLAMASRLSYFLWGSMPDDELFQAARENRLSTDKDLIRQVDRMLDDPRCKSLATDFGMQWLKVQKVASALPDKTLFPKYYQPKMPPPGLSMTIEQLLLFETIMVENRSILEFIRSDFGYLNRQLMDWYQLDIKKSLGYSPPLENFEDFYRIKWNNPHKGGVITAGATMMGTSTTTRTSPVYRGTWVLDVIFNSPPKPAPADVKPLDPSDGGGPPKKMNVRKKLEAHRLDAACASCHDQIDPMGFAVENFDAVGRWRSNYETGDRIDASGAYEGNPFSGSARFKNVILRENSRFVKAFVEHTMKYALGRKLHYSDQPEIRKLAKNVVDENFRFRSVIKQVVLSKMFRRFDEPENLATPKNSAAKTN